MEYAKEVKIIAQRNIYSIYVKPIVDFFFAAIGIAVLMPFILFVIIMIKIDSPGPCLFKQTRIGKNGVSFEIYKFRTMYSHVPNQGKSPNSGNDPRITRIGKILRKTSIDEIPQLINILKGEMSFIGPRPEQEEIVKKHYSKYEMQRFIVKPGITGLWQISEYRKYPIHHNIDKDLKYIENISFKLDMQIFYKTIKVIIISNTY